ncbi:hypothetical protein DV737_g813, partial [Chaetothyriales sp. CBS 132003]
MSGTEISVRERRRYHWPELQLNLWIFVVLAGASTVLGINAWFIVVQKQMQLGIPWLFTFAIVTASLTILFLLLILLLAARRLLIPGGILLGSFILFVLWLTTLIETAIQLFGSGNVNSNCNRHVAGAPFSGVSIETLAWLTQSNICACWKASFAWSIILAVLFLWMIILAWQVQVGDSVPSIEIQEDAPDKKVNLAVLFGSGKGLIIGVPAAFSPTCSNTHIPDYLSHDKLKDAGTVAIITTNDAFVTKAWKKALGAEALGVRVLADAQGEFAKAWDVQFDASPVLGNPRSKRFAAVVDDGKVTKVFVEPDSVGLTGSAAEKILG